MSVFKQFYKSVYSPRDISSYRFQGIGKTILFIFLLSLLSMLPTGYFITSDLTNGISYLEDIFQEDLPEFKIENGKLISSSTEPFTIRSDDFTFILDSTGTITSRDVESYLYTIALLQDELIIYSNANLQTFDYTMVEDMVITDNDIRSFFNTFQSALPILIPMILLMLYIMVSGLKFIEVTLIGLIGLLLKNIVGVNLRFRHTWIIAAYSVTISTVFFTIMEAVRAQVPYAAFLNWAVSVFVLYLAFKEIPKRKK